MSRYSLLLRVDPLPGPLVTVLPTSSYLVLTSTDRGTDGAPL